ncbi:MAG: hypothetical protein M3Z04_04795 [Chloroflexota bacterium]|nr:hypothetical protein [Chloroflexota bacterium]
MAKITFPFPEASEPDPLESDRLARIQARPTPQRYIASSVDSDGHIGALIEVRCETAFVRQTAEFRQLVADLARQVVVSDSHPAGPENSEVLNSAFDIEAFCRRPFIGDPNQTVTEIVQSLLLQIGENIVIDRVVRFTGT